MNNKTPFFILILLISFSSYAQDECRGLNFHSIYSFDTHPSLAEHFSTSDSSSIFLGHIAPVSGLVSKIKKNGLNAWSKQYSTSNFRISLFAGEELKDKNYITVGFLIAPSSSSSIPQRALVIKYDTTGQILWNQVLTVSVPKGNLRSISNVDIEEDLNGNLIVVLSVSSKGVTRDFNFCLVARLDKNGALLWNKLFESAYEIILKIPEQKNNEIELFGNYAFSSLVVPYDRSTALLYLKINAFSGNIIITNSCSIPLSQIDMGNWDFLDGMRVRRINTTSFAISGSAGSNVGSSLQGIVLSFSDNKFSSGYRINSTVTNSHLYGRHISADTSGNAGVVLVGGNGNSKMYYASIGVTGKVNSQMASLLYSDTWATNSTEVNLLAFKGDNTFSFGFPISINSKTFIHHFQLDKNGIDPLTIPCIGSDTTGIISTSPIIPIQNSFAWDTEYDNVLTASTINITTQETPLYKQEICVSKLPPQHPLTLGKDLLLCPNDSALLQVPYTYQSYEWQDASTDPVLNVHSAGVYSLKVQDECGYLYSDTVVINYSNSKLEIGNDLTLCKGDIGVLNSPSGFKSFTWQPVTGVSEKNSAFEFSPAVTTQYKVEAIDGMGCSFTDSLIVEVKDCLNKLFIPSAFSPNSDGKNEVFKPYVEGRIISYRFSIFDRWGNRVFTTTDPGKGWDGKIAGVTQSTSTFVWTCEYQFKGETKEIKKGSLVLIK